MATGFHRNQIGGYALHNEQSYTRLYGPVSDSILPSVPSSDRQSTAQVAANGVGQMGGGGGSTMLQSLAEASLYHTRTATRQSEASRETMEENSERCAKKQRRGSAPNVKQDQRRRERNREHARQSRTRKKILVEALQQQETELQRENEKLRAEIEGQNLQAAVPAAESKNLSELIHHSDPSVLQEFSSLLEILSAPLRKELLSKLDLVEASLGPDSFSPMSPDAPVRTSA